MWVVGEFVAADKLIAGSGRSRISVDKLRLHNILGVVDNDIR